MAKKAAKKSTKKAVKKSVKKATTKGMTKKTAKKPAPTKAKKTVKKARRPAAKRELIDTGTDKRYVRRDAEGQFKESDDVGRSLSADMRRDATTQAGAGQGDRGD